MVLYYIGKNPIDVHNSTDTIKRILVAREGTTSSLAPYIKLEERYNVKLTFRSFISTSSISIANFRKFKPKILAHTALVFTNKAAIDHFFKLAKGASIHLPESTKYLCSTASLAYYLQKYIVFKKRKVIKAEGDISTFFTLLKKHKKEKFLVPSSTTSRRDVIDFLKSNKYSYTNITIYQVVENDFDDIHIDDYDVVVLFSLLDVKAFIKKFSNKPLKHTVLAVFGESTARAVKQAGLSFDIYAPTAQAPSMVDALKSYLKKV